MRPEQQLDGWAEEKRQAAVARARNWTACQSVRLRTTQAAILDAILDRGWLPEQIEQVSGHYALEGLPPVLDGIPSFVDARIARATKATPAGPTAMSRAMERAKGKAA